MDNVAEKKLRSILARVFQVDAKAIDENTSTATVATWDSLAHMQLVFALEEEYGATFTAHQIADMTRYSNIVALIEGIER